MKWCTVQTNEYDLQANVVWFLADQSLTIMWMYTPLGGTDPGYPILDGSFKIEVFCISICYWGSVIMCCYCHKSYGYRPYITQQLVLCTTGLQHSCINMSHKWNRMATFKCKYEPYVPCRHVALTTGRSQPVMGISVFKTSCLTYTRSQ